METKRNGKLTEYRPVKGDKTTGKKVTDVSYLFSDDYDEAKTPLHYTKKHTAWTSSLRKTGTRATTARTITALPITRQDFHEQKALEEARAAQKTVSQKTKVIKRNIPQENARPSSVPAKEKQKAVSGAKPGSKTKAKPVSVNKPSAPKDTEPRKIPTSASNVKTTTKVIKKRIDGAPSGTVTKTAAKQEPPVQVKKKPAASNPGPKANTASARAATARISATRVAATLAADTQTVNPKTSDTKVIHIHALLW